MIKRNQFFPTMEKGADLSPDRNYRYTLLRQWSGGERLVFIGLNPSIADENKDDPTIRRCMGFARSWGYSVLWMVNLFAYRSTSPKGMMLASDPVGPDNDDFLLAVCSSAKMVVAAWGMIGKYKGRDQEVSDMLRRNGITLHCLGTTADGSPRHPLYVLGNTKTVLWS